ncbi:MAG TPA: serine O-acetyltransferase [Arachnia sp.]|nr:serine O-acetyltransferase [Arachnia sp.]HMT85206.1 serine O-acetyltransferase [Arachnia sp.]
MAPTSDARTGRSGLRALIRTDLEQMCEGFPVTGLRLFARLAVHVRWRVPVYWRIAHAGMSNPLTRPLALMLSSRILSISGAEVQPGAHIGPGLVLKHTTGVVVGERVVAGERLTLHQNSTLGDRTPYGGQPVLGDDVTIGAGACVLGPITLGDRVIVAANSVVLEDVPDDCVVAGAPARIVRRHADAPSARDASR